MTADESDLSTRPTGRLSTEHVELVLEASAMGTWEWDVRTGTIRWSPAVEALFGLEPGEFEGTLEAHQRFVDPRDLASLRDATRTALADGGPFRVRYRVRLANGSQRWLESRGAVSRAADGTVRRVVGVCSDVTQEVRREHGDSMLAEAARVLSATMDYEKSLALVGELAVPALADWCSIDLVSDASIFEGVETRRVFVAHVDPAKQAQIERLERDSPCGSGLPFDMKAVIRTGSPKLVEHVTEGMPTMGDLDERSRRALKVLGLRSYLCVPLHTRDHVLGALTLVAAESGRHYDREDLSRAQRLAHHVAQAVERALYHERAERAVAVRNDVLAIVSHDLRSPLNTIHMASNILRSEIADADVRSRLDPIDRAVERADRLIRDLLDVAKAEAGSLSINATPCRIAPIVLDTVASLSPQAESRGVKLEAELPSDEGRVLADHTRVVQVLSNLVSNALRHIDAHGTVRLGAMPEAEDWRFFVEDDGPGVPEDLRPYLFEPFARARRDRDGRDSTGLGLAICRAIVEAHGGRIWLDECQSGARFCFTLPRGTRQHTTTRRMRAIDE